MDPELLKLINLAVEKGITLVNWTLMVLGLIGAGVGAFLGSYLKKTAELLATEKKFDETR